MKGKGVYREGVVQHIYQRAKGKHLIFHSRRDCLVFFSILCVAAEKYGVRLLGVCLMVDHIHLLVEVTSLNQLSGFVRYYASAFSRVYRSEYPAVDFSFQSHYGRATKIGDKAIRTAIAYLYNNPVERQLSSRAENARWNFLAYARSKAPFSERYVASRARRVMRMAVEEIKADRKEGRPICYQEMKRMMEGLGSSELDQLCDIIVGVYNVIDYEALISYYKDYGQMLMAINSNTGNEYDIKEDFVGGSDEIYLKMTRFLISSREVSDIGDLLRMPEDGRRRMREPLSLFTGASFKQVDKFLHLNGCGKNTGRKRGCGVGEQRDGHMGQKYCGSQMADR